MKNTLILIHLILLTCVVNAQDIITKTNGDNLKAKVLEVTQTEIKYKRHESLDGPIYTISKSDVVAINYNDGTKDIFKTSEENKENPTSKNETEKNVLPTNQLNNNPLKKGAKVFVFSEDNASVIHCTSALRKWNYWTIVDNAENADIIAQVDITRKGTAFESIISIINAKSKEPILKTDMALAYASEHYNPKKAAIERAVTQKLLPKIEKR